MARKDDRQAAFDFGEPAASGAAATLTVEGVEFRHGADDRFEYYEHRDGEGRLWELFRTTSPGAHPAIRATWYARLSHAGVTLAMLNCARTRGETVLDAGPLYHLDAHDPRALLRAMAPLIRRGGIPPDAAYERLTVISNGTHAAHEEPEPLAALFAALENDTLDPASEERLFRREPSGSYRACGRFASGRAFDVRGPLREMRQLARALRRHVRGERYARARGRAAADATAGTDPCTPTPPCRHSGAPAPT
jgi:hypothetical protein